MAAEKSLAAVEEEIAGERAASLGRGGRRLRVTLDNLSRFDRHAADTRRLDPLARAKLVKAASDAFWLYVVQREALGLIDSEYIRREYGVPLDVWRRVGPG